MTANKIRFIERDYYRKVMLDNNAFMTVQQIEAILDQAAARWDDLTFKFYENGQLEIINNDTEELVPVKELRGAAYDFYVRERLRFIRASLEAKILQSA